MSKQKLNISVFNKVWWTILSLQFVIVIILKFTIGTQPIDKIMHFMKGFSIFNLIYLFIYKFTMSKDDNFDFNIWNELPLYLCNIGSILAFCATKYNNQTFMGFCYCVGTVGALMAYLMPEENFVDIPLFSCRALGFYGYHGLLIIINLSFKTLGLFNPNFHILKEIIILCIIIVLLVHTINILLRRNIYPEANYMFTVEPTNSVLEKIYKICPVKCIYLYLLLPLVALLYLLMCL
ncbi:MAG: YwaF family protein [Erysipelotrichia bacterium]|nr:YwaF family protein [Erysipelotrichia bacterium]